MHRPQARGELCGQLCGQTGCGGVTSLRHISSFGVELPFGGGRVCAKMVWIYFSAQLFTSALFPQENM